MSSGSFKDDLTIKKIGGIDTRPSRESARFSEGKNFYTRGGSMFSRPGSVVLATAPMGTVTSMYSAPIPGSDTLLIVQLGNKVYHYVDETWTEKYTLSSAVPLKYTRFINKVVMVNGTDRIMMDITTGVYETLVVAGVTQIPELAYTTTWRFRVWGWNPLASDAHLLKFCGYDENTMIDPKVWPPTFTLNVGGTAGSPVFGAFSAGNHLLVLTETTYTPIYGNTEEDFEIGTSGTTSVLRPGVMEEINGVILWLGKDVNNRLIVNIYSGTEPVTISEPIADYLDDVDLEKVFTKSFFNQFWVINPRTTDTLVCVYDLQEREWFIYELPFVVSSGTVFGEYLKDDYIYLGSATRVIKLDPLVDTDINDADIITAFTLGPIAVESRILKPKTVHVTAIPSNNFTLSLTQVVDDNPEPTSLPIPFTTTSPVKQVTENIKVSRDKGYNMSYRFSTTDKINKINGFTVIFKGKGLR